MAEEKKKKPKKSEKESSKDHKEHKFREKLKRAVKPPKKEEKQKLFEEKPDLQRLFLLTVVVEQPVANQVVKLLQDLGSSAQFVHNGRGTAPSEIMGILNASVDRKAIINAFVSEDKMQVITEELGIFLGLSRKNRGVGFFVPLSSIQGIRMYKYLTQTIL